MGDQAGAWEQVTAPLQSYSTGLIAALKRYKKVLRGCFVNRYRLCMADHVQFIATHSRLTSKSMFTTNIKG